jgi:glycine cleavage system H protein
MREPVDYRFVPTHEWVRVEGEELVVGITEYAQQRLSDIIHVELPEPDEHHYEAHEDFITLESLKTALDFHAPTAGRIVAVNSELLSNPELINEDPYGEGWLVRMIPDNMDDLQNLLNYHEYEGGLPEEEEEEE